MASSMIGPKYSKYMCIHLEPFSLSTGINIRQLLPFGWRHSDQQASYLLRREFLILSCFSLSALYQNTPLS